MAGRITGMLESREEILAAFIFGSFLKNYPFRDIDVAVYTAREVDALDYKIRLEEKLSGSVGYPVDVTVLNSAPAWLARKMLVESRLLFSRRPLLPEKLYLKALDEEMFLDGSPSLEQAPRYPGCGKRQHVV